MSIKSFDKATGMAEFLFEPDPARYEWSKDGSEVYDRFDDTHMPRDVVMTFLREALEAQPPPPVPILADIEWWVRERRPVIYAGLSDTEPSEALSAASEELLSSRAGDELGFVVLVLDVENSSALSAATPPGELARLIGTFLTEVSELVAVFHGHVLRYQGDGLVAYFPEPSFISNNDFAVDCALCIQRLVETGFNPEAEKLGFPALAVRIGLDAGEAAVRVLGSPRTKRHADIIGDVMSLASNIEAEAPPGRVLIGGMVEQNLHYEWREQCQKSEPPPGWDYTDTHGQPYTLHLVSSDARRPIEARAGSR